MIILRLIAAPVFIAFVIVGLSVFAILAGLAWIAIGEQVMVHANYPDWR